MIIFSVCFSVIGESKLDVDEWYVFNIMRLYGNWWWFGLWLSEWIFICRSCLSFERGILKIFEM